MAPTALPRREPIRTYPWWKMERQLDDKQGVKVGAAGTRLALETAVHPARLDEVRKIYSPQHCLRKNCHVFNMYSTLIAMHRTSDSVRTTMDGVQCYFICFWSTVVHSLNQLLVKITDVLCARRFSGYTNFSGYSSLKLEFLGKLRMRL